MLTFKPVISKVNILDARAIWVREFGRSMAKLVPTAGLLPSVHNTGIFRRRCTPIAGYDGLSLKSCHLQRGWWRSGPLNERAKLVRFVESETDDPDKTLVIFSAPHYLHVARALPRHPKVYYVTDNFRGYSRQDDNGPVGELERLMAQAVDLVCPNSPRTAKFFQLNCSIPQRKIRLIPNGFREENLPAEPLLVPAGPPPELDSVPRPWALVLGNLAANVDWKFLQAVVNATAWLHWVFIGPSEMSCADDEDEEIRVQLLRNQRNIRYLGSRDPGQLYRFARACDIAVAPYRRAEPTISGSSTRSYEHFASGRPLVATNGMAELCDRTPLVAICPTSDAMIAELERLRSIGFSDGLEIERWRIASGSTWLQRAQAMLNTINAGTHQNRAKTATDLS